VREISDQLNSSYMHRNGRDSGRIRVDRRMALAAWSSPGGHAVILGGLGAHGIWAMAFSIFF